MAEAVLDHEPSLNDTCFSRCCLWEHATSTFTHMWRPEASFQESVFSPSVMLVLGMEFRLAGLATGAFTL